MDDNMLVDLYRYLSSHLKGKKTDFWDELSNEQKADIEEGINDLDNGRKICFEKFIEKHQVNNVEL